MDDEIGLLAEIKLFAGDFPPKYWEVCVGQVLPINTDTALFSLLGTPYGGGGTTTFDLPNLAPAAGQTPIRHIICVNGIHPQRREQ